MKPDATAALEGSIQILRETNLKASEAHETLAKLEKLKALGMFTNREYIFITCGLTLAGGACSKIIEQRLGML